MSELNRYPNVEYPDIAEFSPYGDDGKLDRFKLQIQISDYLRRSFVIYNDLTDSFYKWNAKHDYVYSELTDGELDRVIIPYLDHYRIRVQGAMITDLIRYLKNSLLLWNNNPINLMPPAIDSEGDYLSPEEQLEKYECYPTDPRADNLRDSYSVFAFNNGLMNFTTGELLPFTPYIFVTDNQRIYCDWKPEITTHELGQRLLTGMFEDPKTLNSVLDMMAYAIYRTPYDLVRPYVWILYGMGDTGKGRTFEVIKTLIGNKGYTSPYAESLFGNFGKECLLGKRACLSNEVSKNFLETNWLKEISEGSGTTEKRTIERKHKRPIEALINCSFVFATNNVMQIGTDSGMKRRVRVIPYRVNQSLYERDWRALMKDPTFYSWITGVLYERWMMIQGRMGSIEETPDVAKATAMYMREQSNIECFMHDLLIEEADNNTIVLPSSVNQNLPDDDPDIIADMITSNPRYRERHNLYEIYRAYCSKWNLIVHTPQVFNNELTNKYPIQIRESNGRRLWVRSR